MRALLLVLAAVAALVIPAGALAASQPFVPIVPPGNSGANEYVENVPTASGSGSSTAIKHRSSSSPSSSRAISPSTVGALSAQGTDGRQAAALAIATAPSAPAGATGGRRSRAGAVAGGGSTGGGSPPGGHAGGSPSGRPTAQPAGSAPAATLLKSVLGSSGTGIDAWLPAGLAVVAAAIAVLAFRRRRAAG